MGIQDRDYMQRRPEDDDPDAWKGNGSPRRPRGGGPDLGAKLERFFSGILARYPRLPKIIGFTIVALAVIAIAVRNM